MGADGDTTKRDGRVLPLPLRETVDDSRLIDLPGQALPAKDTLSDSSVLALPQQGSALDTVVPPRPAAASPLGRVGGFVLEGELGRGGMGVVYRARSVALGRAVALKVLRAGDAADDDEVARFQIEARAAARLRHPGIVGVHEVGRDGDRWFLVMDLIAGESLRARLLRDGPLPAKDVARIGAALAGALEHAHAQGVLHRDLKPHNVLLDAATGAPVLTDFGLAKEVGRDESGLTVTGQVLGTPAYMAPEQAAGDTTRVGERSDVYGLGATLYEALTGRPPFAGPTAINVLRAVIEDEPLAPSKLRPGVPVDLETVVLTCLEKDPARRYASAADLAADLERVVALEPIAARRRGPAERAARWLRRHRAHLGAALLFAGLGLAGAWAVAGARERQRRDERRAATIEALAQVRAGRPGDVASATSTLYLAEQWWRAAPDDPEAKEGHRAAARLVGERERWHDQLLRAASAFDLAAESGDPDGAAAAAWCRAVVKAREEVDTLVYGEAAARLESLVGQGRPWWQAAAGLAFARLAMGDLDGARRAADAAVEAEPDHAHAWLTRGRVLGARGEVEPAFADANRALELAPNLAAARALRAILRMRRGDPEGAVRDATAAITMAPTALEPVMTRAMALITLERPREALADAERAVALAPGLARPLALQAVARFELGDFDGAREDVRLLRTRPTDALGAAIEGRILLLDRRPEEALHAFDRALAMEPGNESVRERRGQALLELGDPEAALADLERACALAPDRGGLAWYLRARACFILGRVDEAGRHVLKALELEPDPGPAIVLLAHCLLAQGDEAGARAQLARADACELDEPFSLGGRALLRGTFGRLDDARADLDRALELAPDDPTTLAHRASVRLEQGDAAGAEADATRCLSSAEHPIGLRVRGRALAALGRVTEARRDLERLLELGVPERVASEVRRELEGLR